jgi:hypothetical protein
MTDIVKNMVTAYYNTPPPFKKAPSADKAMRAALMWLADHYEQTVWSTPVKLPGGETVQIFKLVAAVIRAAAEGDDGR